MEAFIKTLEEKAKATQEEVNKAKTAVADYQQGSKNIKAQIKATEIRGATYDGATQAYNDCARLLKEGQPKVLEGEIAN